MKEEGIRTSSTLEGLRRRQGLLHPSQISSASPSQQLLELTYVTRHTPSRRPVARGVRRRVCVVRQPGEPGPSLSSATPSVGDRSPRPPLPHRTSKEESI